MQNTNHQTVLSQNLGEGCRILSGNGALSPPIQTVEWTVIGDDEDDFRVDVFFEDDTKASYDKGATLQQIWHEDV